MQLHYRFSSYTLNQPTVTTEETGLSAMFLGKTYSVRRCVHPFTGPTQPTLKYRGNTYQNG